MLDVSETQYVYFQFSELIGQGRNKTLSASKLYVKSVSLFDTESKNEGLMYSIIDLGGHQIKVSAGNTIKINTVDAQPEQIITFERIMLFSDNNTISVGRPLLSGATVKAKVLSHGKADKVMVFKKHRRKDYRKKVGHRQPFTKVLITEIAMGDKKEVYEAKPKKAPVVEVPAQTAVAAPEDKPVKKTVKKEKKG
jgi:large subunit ribosomal protein L21